MNTCCDAQRLLLLPHDIEDLPPPRLDLRWQKFMDEAPGHRTKHVFPFSSRTPDEVFHVRRLIMADFDQPNMRGEFAHRRRIEVGARGHAEGTAPRVPVFAGKLYRLAGKNELPIEFQSFGICS